MRKNIIYSLVFLVILFLFAVFVSNLNDEASSSDNIQIDFENIVQVLDVDDYKLQDNNLVLKDMDEGKIFIPLKYGFDANTYDLVDLDINAPDGTEGIFFWIRQGESDLSSERRVFFQVENNHTTIHLSNDQNWDGVITSMAFLFWHDVTAISIKSPILVSRSSFQDMLKDFLEPIRVDPAVIHAIRSYHYANINVIVFLGIICLIGSFMFFLNSLYKGNRYKQTLFVYISVVCFSLFLIYDLRFTIDLFQIINRTNADFAMQDKLNQRYYDKGDVYGYINFVKGLTDFDLRVNDINQRKSIAYCASIEGGSWNPFRYQMMPDIVVNCDEAKSADYIAVYNYDYQYNDGKLTVDDNLICDSCNQYVYRKKAYLFEKTK